MAPSIPDQYGSLPRLPPPRIRRELERYAALFDTIERAPLTYEQRLAAVTMAHRHLLIAAAGSGKTSSMVGKVAYAIRGGHCTPDQVLVLAFNRKAARELQERLGPELPVTVRTLHALGLDIVTRVKGQRPRVHNDTNTVMRQVLKQLIQHDPLFADHWLMFRVLYHIPVRHPCDFTSRRQWRRFVSEHGERRKRHSGFVTLCGKLVPTQLEQTVANWLHLHGMDSVYASARPWWPGCRSNASGWTAGAGFRRPLSGRAGFYLPKTGSWVFCLDGCRSRAGLPSSAVVVRLDEFLDATLFTNLRTQFPDQVSKTDPGRVARMLTLLGYRLTPGQADVLERFIALARLNGIDPAYCASRAMQTSDPTRTRMHAPMLAILLEAYQAALDADDGIDFEGMLHRAADHLDAGVYTHGYTLIMVDEFQDTSRGGVRLLKSLLAQNFQCRLFAVGDDWQSIYRFAGAVPDVLSRFEHYFGSAVTHFLTATFRFDQTVADAASRFVQANPAQLRKHVRARAAGRHASIVTGRYAGAAHMYALCERCLRDASTSHTVCGSKTSVYILGRYQHQRPRELHGWCTRYPQLDIQYLTVHSAKGLEADVVVVLGLHTGRYGFPSRVPDDPLTELVMPDREVFPDAEERRLFYVAITRCRIRVYLLSDLHHPSPFVAELSEGGEDVANFSTICF